MFRIDGRENNEPRLIKIEPSYLAFAEGSTFIEVGQTKLICSASVEQRVPPFLKGQGKGWVTAEYSMLPRSTLTRKTREIGSKGLGGRTQEIQRLIGVKTWVAVCIPHCIEKNRCHKCGNNKASRERKREQMRPILIDMQRR